MTVSGTGAGSGETSGVTVRPVSVGLWSDLREVFLTAEETRNCWCMWWRRPTLREARLHAGPPNEQAHLALVEGGKTTGLIAYVADRPAGWCSVGPRADFARIATSAVRTDDACPAWSTVCFHVAPWARKRRVATALLEAAIAYAEEHGAEYFEGYPRPVAAPLPGASLYAGTVSMFTRLGFAEVPRVSRLQTTQVIMRLPLGQPRRNRGLTRD